MTPGPEIEAEYMYCRFGWQILILRNSVHPSGQNASEPNDKNNLMKKA